MKHQALYKFKNYTFTITADETSLLELHLKEKLDNNTSKEQNSIIKETIKQLDEYFLGERKNFELPIKLNGTNFQQKIWKNLQKIPYGTTVSYKQLAEASGNAKACRAAGMANNKNPIAIIIPCHRVIGSNGQLTGYAGGLKLKEELLELEKHYANN